DLGSLRGDQGADRLQRFAGRPPPSGGDSPQAVRHRARVPAAASDADLDAILSPVAAVYFTHPDADAVFRETLSLARRAPFYREHLAGAAAPSLSEIGRLPVTTKEHLR